MAKTPEQKQGQNLRRVDSLPPRDQKYLKQMQTKGRQPSAEHLPSVPLLQTALRVARYLATHYEELPEYQNHGTQDTTESPQIPRDTWMRNFPIDGKTWPVGLQFLHGGKRGTPQESRSIGITFEGDRMTVAVFSPTTRSISEYSFDTKRQIVVKRPPTQMLSDQKMNDLLSSLLSGEKNPTYLERATRQSLNTQATSLLERLRDAVKSKTEVSDVQIEGLTARTIVHVDRADIEIGYDATKPNCLSLKVRNSPITETILYRTNLRANIDGLMSLNQIADALRTLEFVLDIGSSTDKEEVAKPASSNDEHR